MRVYTFRLQKVKCRLLLLFRKTVYSYGKIDPFYGILFKLLLFALYTVCVFFLFQHGENFRALHSNIHSLTHSYHARRTEKKTNNQANNTQLQYKENHVLQIVYNPFVCCSCECAQSFFFLERNGKRDRENGKIKNKHDDWQADGLAILKQHKQVVDHCECECVLLFLV